MIYANFMKFTFHYLKYIVIGRHPYLLVYELSMAALVAELSGYQ